MNQKQKILIADDEDFIRKLSSRILSLEGYDIIQAKTGEEALKLYKVHKNEIVLAVVDIRMPGMTGVELYHHMISINPIVRVILCSGYGDYELPTRSEKYFIQKPFSVKDLTNMVRKVLNYSKEEVKKNNEEINEFKIFIDE